jgi:hypothetical protein
MINRECAASYERGVELTEVGCPLDYPDTLLRSSATRRTPFRAEPLEGSVESRVNTLGFNQTGYVISLRLSTELPRGVVITDWNFLPPWQNHLINWEYDPLDIIPKRDREDYKSLLDFRLMRVLNNHWVLKRGHPVEGLICGCAYQPIPESSGASVPARINLVDEAGNTITLCFGLAVYRSASRRSNARPPRAGRLLEKMCDRASR